MNKEYALTWRILKNWGSGLVDTTSVQCHGVYLWILKTDELPFYVGTVEGDTFVNRLNVHRKLFNTLERTFFRKEYLDTYKQWPLGLKDIHKADSQASKLIHVPGDKVDADLKSSLEKEGTEFWEKEVLVLAASVDGTPDELKNIETKIQKALIAGLSEKFSVDESYFRVPRFPRSMFLGKQQGTASVSLKCFFPDSASFKKLRDMFYAAGISSDQPEAVKKRP